MKKIFSYVAMAAMVLGMASCDENVSINRFKMHAEEVTETSAYVYVTPPDEDMTYVPAVLTYGSFKWFKKHENGMENMLVGYSKTHGSTVFEYNNLVPGTKYVICAAEQDPVSENIVGKVDYVGFVTKNIEAKKMVIQDGELEYVPMNGLVRFYGDEKDILSFVGDYVIPGTDYQRLRIHMFVNSERVVGRFKTDDLIHHSFIAPYLCTVDKAGEEKDFYVIYKANVVGTFDETSGKTTFKGWVDAYKNGDAIHVPFEMVCTES